MSKDNLPILKSLCYDWVLRSAVIARVNNSFPFKQVRRNPVTYGGWTKNKPKVLKRDILS